MIAVLFFGRMADLAGQRHIDVAPGPRGESLFSLRDRLLADAIAAGQVNAGQPVVFVAAASSHRRAAFEAIDYAMDRLKSEAAFWKRETGPGLDRWIEPTARDAADLGRWTLHERS